MSKKINSGRYFTADFETTTDINDTRVWAYGISQIGNSDNFIYGNNIDDFMKWCLKDKRKNYTIYFHNLKFDGEFIIYWLFKNGYTYIPDRKDRTDKSFTTLITEMGVFYSIEVYETAGNNPNKVTFLDSLKLLNMSVDNVSKSFSLPIDKLEIDYHKKRDKDHILTDEEIRYIKNDVTIMSLALEEMFKSDIDKMTIASSALADYKKTNKYFNKRFPQFDIYIDEFIRDSYKGGFTYLNPLYQNKIIDGYGVVLDVNSLYPSIMFNEYLPYGNPIYFKGKHIPDNIYPLYVQKLSCSFKLKPGKIPTIQIKNSFYFNPVEYLESSNDEIILLTLTNIDLELFLENYNVYDLTYHDGYKFTAIKGLFTDYISKWTEVKIKAGKSGNTGKRTIAKLMLNSLYGKFGTNPKGKLKMPYLRADDSIGYIFLPEEIRDPLYIPVASFITSYARNKVIRTAQKIRDYSIYTYGEDYYVYTDTDSIHCINMTIEQLSNIVDIDNYELRTLVC